MIPHINKLVFLRILFVLSVATVIIWFFIAPIKYWHFNMAKAQGGFQIGELPYNGQYEIWSYVDHDAISGTFMFMNGDSYRNEQPYFYDGHTGLDWPLTYQEVKATNAGTVTFRALGPDTFGYLIIITHGDYDTYYAHLRIFSETNILLNIGDVVTQGQVIGISGNTAGLTRTWGAHLHFEVRHPDTRTKTDPFGWRGEAGQDPLAYNGVDSQCLWNNEWCQETIVEDRDFPIRGTAHYEEVIHDTPDEHYQWHTSEPKDGGNQNGFRYLESAKGILTGTWKPTLPRKGRYEIFAFIPPSHATTEKAIYHINTPMGVITATLNQSATVGRN